MIRIYDINGLSALENYLKENNLTLHQDSTNMSSLENNLENIRYYTNLFNEKYKNDLDIGYRDFNKHAIGGYVCLDAKVEVLSSFLLEENPFKSDRPKDQILGLELSDIIKQLCDYKVLSSEQYRRNKTKNMVHLYLKKHLFKNIYHII